MRRHARANHRPPVDDAVTAERRFANQTIFRVGLPSGVSSFGEFALEAVAFIWIVSTVGADSPVASLFIGALLVASTLPRLLVSPYAGAMADTWGARRSLVLADLSRFVLVGAFAAYLYATGSSEDAAAAIPLVVACFLVASASELLGPARAVAIRAGVPSVHRPRASSVTLAIMKASSIATGGLAPLMFATWGLQPVLLAITGSFVVGAVLAQWLVVGKIG